MSDDDQPATVTIQKIGAFVTASRDLLEGSAAFTGAWRVAMGLAPDPRSPEQIAADRERLEQEYAAAEAEVAANHAAHLAAADGVGRAVLELHAPVAHGYRAQCEGCDSEGYESEYPDWPCRTYQLVVDIGALGPA